MNSTLLLITTSAVTFFLGYVWSYVKFQTERAKNRQNWWRLIPISITLIPYIASMTLVFFWNGEVKPISFQILTALGYIVVWGITNFINNCSQHGHRYYFYVAVVPLAVYVATYLCAKHGVF